VRSILIATRVAAVALAIALTVGLMAPAAHAATTKMTATENVNVRSGPSTKHKIVGGLYRGQTVTAVSKANGWTKINFDGGRAYVASQYLAKGAALPPPSQVEAGVVKVTTTDVNLRNGPGLSNAVITVLPDGTRVTTTGKTSRGYAEVIKGSLKGWASTQYLDGVKTGLPTVIGIRVATADLDIRTSSGPTARTVAEVKKGTGLSVTGATQNGRAQIIFAKKVRWVTAKYLANPRVNLPGAPGLPKIIGSRYATAELSIRSTYKNEYTLITVVPVGTKLSLTGVVKNSRRQIVFNNAARWVTDKYLSRKKPSTSTPASWKAVERGLKPNAIKVHRAARRTFPQIVTYYTVRSDPIPDHPSGRALDLMIPNYKSSSGEALGASVAKWARGNAKSLGIQYVIWDQRIWNIQRNGEGWRYMADRGGDSANHKNHVHITVYG
jgi:uncharacterized protein YgiM (DUF1202 family)